MTCYRYYLQLDEDRNGLLSKAELLQFGRPQMGFPIPVPACALTAARARAAAADASWTSGAARRRCTFEDSVSTELLVRLAVYPKMRDALQVLPHKMLSLRFKESAAPTEPSMEQLEGRVERIVERIKAATFRSEGDKVTVSGLYTGYVGRIATVLTRALATVLCEEAAVQLPLGGARDCTILKRHVRAAWRCQQRLQGW